MNKKFLLPLLALISVAIFFAACQPDDPDNGNDKTPKNVKTFSGTTDQNENVKFRTGEISNELWLLEYQLTVIFVDSSGGSYEEQDYSYSESESDGIKKMTNNSFNISLGTNDFINGTVNSGQTEISGTYSYEFITTEGDTVVTGNFSATASK